MNRFVWDLRYTDATTVPGALLWGGTTRGPLVVPGTYSVLLIEGKDTLRQSFEVKLDPRVETAQADLQEQLNFPIKLNNKIAAVASSVGSADTRPTKQQYDVFAELSAKADAQLHIAKGIVSTDVPAFNKLVKEQDVPAVILKSERREGRRPRE